MTQTLGLLLLLLPGVLAAQAETASKRRVPPLIANIWRLKSTDPSPQSGSIWVFLSDGELLETSCVETYRIATWKEIPGNAGTIAVTEDGELAFTATARVGSDGELRLRQTMSRGNHETRDLIFSPVKGEFICPDLPK